MKRLAILLGFLIIAALAPEIEAAPPASARYIVVLKESADPNDFARGRGQVPHVVYEHALKGYAATLPAASVASLRADPDVVLVERDSIMTTFDIPTGVNRVDAEENSLAAIVEPGNGGNLSIDIAIIDTGIAAHPKLNLAGGVDFSRTSFLCRSQSFFDGHGHGTHVAGTAAAMDTVGPNGTRVVGVAPGARVWAVKVLADNGSGYTSCVIKGVDWVASRAPGSTYPGERIEIANMSLGGGNSSALCTAIKKATDKGVTFAVAAGNSDTDAATSSPGNCSSVSTGVLTVAAIADYNGLGGGLASPTCTNYGPDDSFATFSNFGSVVNIAAPGVCIYSTYKGGGYATMSGTSMASPHAAGAAALYKLANPGAPPSVVRDGVINNSRLQSDASCGYAKDATDTASQQATQVVKALYVGTSGNCTP